MLLSACQLSNVHANDNFMQNYYNDGVKIMADVKRCSAIKNQFSSETTLCLTNLSSKLQLATKTFYDKNKNFFNSEISSGGSDNLKIENTARLNELKKSCEELYPVPLRGHFKNQILECQVQMDLQRYFFFPSYMLNS